MFFDKLSHKLGSKIATLIIIFSLVVVASLILLGVKLIPSTVTRPDLSANSMYTLSPETEKMIAELDKNVTIYLISAPGEENEGIRTFLERYACKSKKITLKSLDTVADAEEIYNYSGSTPPSNSVVVKTDERYKLIPYYDLFYYGEDAYNFALQVYVQYYNAGVIDSSIGFMDFFKNYAVYDGCYSGYEYEESINSAIRHVTSESLKKIYLLAGHDEDAPSFDVYNHITNFGIALSRINIGKVDIPSDASLLLLFPNTDISLTEKEKILEYMANGGKILLVTTYGGGNTNIEAVLKEYGLETDGKYLCEDNENYNFEGKTAYTVPDISDEGLADTLAERGGTLLLAGTGGITFTAEKPEGITLTPLLTTSPESFTTDDTTNYKFDAEKDTRKTRYTGVSAMNENGGGVVWISSPSVLYEEYNIYTNGGNLLALTYYINMLTENSYEEPVSAVMLASARMDAPKWFVYTFASIVCGVIPLSLIGFAVIRKKKKGY